MSKWKLTDASAKRIFRSYALEKTPGDSYGRLWKAVNSEALDRRSMREMLIWIGDNYPEHLPLLADSLSHLYETLREKTRNYLSAFDALSNDG